MMITSVQERVDHGADYLDHLIGSDWPSQIDLSTLDLIDGCHCVLGQLKVPFGRFVTVVVELELRSPECVELGFLIPSVLLPSAQHTIYAREAEGQELTAEWERVIRPRQETKE